MVEIAHDAIRRLGRKMEHEHSVEAIAARLAAGPRQNYLRDWIYGGIDKWSTASWWCSGLTTLLA